MKSFLWSQLAHRRSRAAALGIGILVAAVSFTLLTSAADTTQLTVKRTVTKNFRAAYDILVRPKGSFTSLEQEQGLVRENYLSGIFGGITSQQYRDIKTIPGVEVAAPIANIGYIFPFEFVPMRIDPFLSDEPVQLYRLKLFWSGDRGLSRYPDADHFIYYTKRNPFVKTSNAILKEVMPDGARLGVCSGFVKSLLLRSVSTDPFDLSRQSGLACYSGKSPRVRVDVSDYGTFPPGVVGTTSSAHFPLLVAAIDPVQERKLIDLDRTIVSGRPLGPLDVAERITSPFSGRVVPVVVSKRTYVDEKLLVDVERLRPPPGTNLPRRLSSSKGTDLWLKRLPGERVGRLVIPAGPSYERLVRGYEPDPQSLKFNNISYNGYWTSSSTRYRRFSARELTPRVVRNPRSVFVSDYYGAGWAPRENLDAGFRQLQSHQMNPNLGATLHVVGRFDPNKLPGFSRFSRVPLETYYPPRVIPGDAAARRALDGRPLRPTQNLAGYVTQPPLMLTTLEGMKPFLDPNIFDLGGMRPKDPISVIRVRVSGVKGPDPLSREKIKGVATAIHDRTDLAVDITAGSSPQRMTIELPAGRFGRPALTLQEGWVQKGVAVEFLTAIDKKSAVLFALILLICGFFLANAAFASVRTRRSEIGTLRCLGWRRKKVFLAVLGEIAFVGLLAGLAGNVIAIGAAFALSLDLPLLRTFWVPPLAVIVAVLAGLLPAWRATLSRPIDAVRPAVAVSREAASVRGVTRMALSNLRRLPGRTALGAAGLTLGVAAFTILLALNGAFQGALVGNLLGNYISVQIRGVDFLSVLLVIALGGFSIADVLFLNLKERAAEVVTLYSVGWRKSHLRRLIAVEGIGMGLAGSVTGVALGVLVASLIRGVALSSIATAALIAGGVGAVVAVIASLAPLASVGRLSTPTILAEEW